MLAARSPELSHIRAREDLWAIYWIIKTVTNADEYGSMTLR